MEMRFEFVQWKIQQLEKKKEKQPELIFWKKILCAICDHHFLEKKENEEYKAVCEKCGIEDTGQDEPFYLREDMTQGCHNCVFFEEEGGEWVPYGSQGAHLPTHQYCGHKKFEEDTPEQEKEMKDYMAHDDRCPLWEGLSIVRR